MPINLSRQKKTSAYGGQANVHSEGIEKMPRLWQFGNASKYSETIGFQEFSSHEGFSNLYQVSAFE